MADLTSRYQRFFSITSDAFGVDPLKDKLVPEIMKIGSYTIHEVTQDERGAPDLISEREYGSDEFWWCLLTYNGICSWRSLVEGTTLRVPNLSALVAVVTQNALRPNSVRRVVTI
jgi:hypothetical protein